MLNQSKPNINNGVKLYFKTFNSNGISGVVTLCNKLNKEFYKNPNYALFAKLFAIEFCGMGQTVSFSEEFKVPTNILNDYFSSIEQVYSRINDRLFKMGFSSEESKTLLEKLNKIVLEELRARQTKER